MDEAFPKCENISVDYAILEKAEENDMMRFIENGHKVHAIVSPYKTVSVDTPKDLALVNTILKEKQHG